MTNVKKLFVGIAIAAIGLISTLGTAGAYSAVRDAVPTTVHAWDAAAVLGYDASAALGYDAGATPMRTSGGRDAGSVTPH